ncbi:MAG TPA: hypothetical protein DCX32_02760 [Candidatus Moranbacteria bacterium]|nr:MAG: hypothetical protein UW95_C0004G0044 [Parcubacteria group bacterium GW2011_GWC1_45_14]HAV11441.1 hypothetical protein [Candidatus Moranbacteria bacterium]
MSSINIHFKNSDFKASKARNSGAMKKVMELGSAQKALKHESQRQAFYDALKRNKDPRHMDKALKKTLGEFLVNGDDKITTRAVREMGKEFVKHGKRFIVPKKQAQPLGSDKRGVGGMNTPSRLSGIMDRRGSRSSIDATSSGQTQNSPARIPMVSDHGMRSKIGGISPSFGGTRPTAGTSSPVRH